MNQDEMDVLRQRISKALQSYGAEEVTMQQEDGVGPDELMVEWGSDSFVLKVEPV